MRHRVSVCLTVALLASTPAVGRAQTAAELAAQRYSVDPMHSTVGFATTLLGAVKVRGRFTAYDATIICDTRHPERSSVSAIIQATSINTDMQFRDDHLRSPDFFDVKTFPTIEFVSDRVIPRLGGVMISGTLTMHGVSRHITFPAKMVGAPYKVGSTAGVAFVAELKLSRKDYGIAGTNKFNPDYNPLTNMLSDNVDITLELDAIRDGFGTRTLGLGTPPGVADTVSHVLRTSGVDAAIAAYRALHASQPAHYDFGADQLDIIGHQLAERRELPSALAILKVNAEQFPNEAWVLESLGETQALANDGAGALATYRLALAKSPGSVNAREMVRRLERVAGTAAGSR